MKFHWVRTCILLLFASNVLTAQNLPEPQKPARLVNDFAKVMNRMEVNQLESMLVAYDDSTSTQITIVTISSLDGYEIADYANRLYEKWGIGQAGKNNGILVLVAVNDREVRLEVGYGLEDRLTDAVSRRIIEQDLLPQFRTGNYAGGLMTASKRIMLLMSGAYEASQNADEPGGQLGLLLVLLLLIIIIAANSRNGGGSNFTGKGRSAYQPPFFFPMGGGGFGGGGGFSGGGFGGFGGGLSGGGGASGRW